jgi:uncharacterized protein (DUF427 family)
MKLTVRERASSRVIASAQPDTETNDVFKFEGNWYFDARSVDFTNLKVTERTYTCPYKGMCYWIDLETPEGINAQNIGWVYRQPKPGYENITDKIAFYARDTSGTTSVTE